jgi:outer membrane protein
MGLPQSHLSAVLLTGGLSLVFLGGCVPIALPPLDSQATAASHRVLWTPPSEPQPKTPEATSGATPPPELPVAKLGLADAVDLALRHQPATRAAWARARAAAENYGVQRAGYAPRVTLEAGTSLSATHNSEDGDISRRAALGPSVGLSWLLFDFGGRAAAVEGSRHALWAANWAQNATLQETVLAVQRGYYLYLAAKATLEARKATLRSAELHREAAEGRHDAGVATLADVLQARTAVAQARLAAQTVEGQIHTTRGALAAAMGLPANLPFEVEELPGDVPAAEVERKVEELISLALSRRSDLASARAQGLAAKAEARRTRAEALPTLNLTGSGGVALVDQDTASGAFRRWEESISAGLFLRVPLYTGSLEEHRTERARAEAEAARENARALEQQVIFQVFNSYHSLRTATQKVRTTEELLASASRFAEVAEGRYREGVGTMLDLVTAEAALADARAQGIQARWEWYTLLAQLARDAGLLETTGGNPLIPGAAGR